MEEDDEEEGGLFSKQKGIPVTVPAIRRSNINRWDESKSLGSWYTTETKETGAVGVMAKGKCNAQGCRMLREKILYSEDARGGRECAYC